MQIPVTVPAAAAASATVSTGSVALPAVMPVQQQQTNEEGSDGELSPEKTSVSKDRMNLPPVVPFKPADNGVMQQKRNGSPVNSFQIIQPKKTAASSPAISSPAPFKPGDTGLPANLQKSMESISGFSLKDVNVHYNSDKPAQLQAHAYAQGNTIHVAPGQEKHLPHEAWHVVQQKQGRVQPTVQLKDAMINDDAALEREADAMGAKAVSSMDTYASGFEQTNRQDVADIKNRSSLVSVSQRQTLDMINNEISASSRTPLTTGTGLQVQRQIITQLAAKNLVVEDGSAPAATQVTKSSFLATLRTEIKKISQEILGPVGLAQADCPDLNYWLSYYEAKEVTHIEAAMLHYAPAAANAETAVDFMHAIAERVRTGLHEHVNTGSLEVDPEPMADSDITQQRIERTEAPLQLQAATIQLGCLCGESVKEKAERERREAYMIELRKAAKEKKEKADNAFKTKGNSLAMAVKLRELYSTSPAGADTKSEEAPKDGDDSKKAPVIKPDYEKIVKAIMEADTEVSSKYGIEWKGYLLEELYSCSGTARALSNLVLGHNPEIDPAAERETVAGAIRSTVQTTSVPADRRGSVKTAEVLNQLTTGNTFYYLKTAGSIASHDFVVINHGGSYDLYESDTNPAIDTRITFLNVDPELVRRSQSGTGMAADVLGERIANILVRCDQKNIGGGLTIIAKQLLNI